MSSHDFSPEVLNVPRPLLERDRVIYRALRLLENAVPPEPVEAPVVDGPTLRVPLDTTQAVQQVEHEVAANLSAGHEEVKPPTEKNVNATAENQAYDEDAARQLVNSAFVSGVNHDN